MLIQDLFKAYCRYFLYGVIAGIIWAGLWVLLGASFSWEDHPSKTLPAHLSHGLSFARAVNIVSLFLGGSVGLTIAFSGWSKNTNFNAGLVGFFVTHVALTILNLGILIGR